MSKHNFLTPLRIVFETLFFYVQSIIAHIINFMQKKKSTRTGAFNLIRLNNLANEKTHLNTIGMKIRFKL